MLEGYGAEVKPVQGVPEDWELLVCGCTMPSARIFQTGDGKTEWGENGAARKPPSRFSTDVTVSVGSTLELMETLPSHFPFKVTILFSVADLVPSCACPKVIWVFVDPFRSPS